MTTRIDLFSHVHKAVRSLLFDAVRAVGDTDFAQASEIPEVLATVRRTVRMTRSHAEHEDREILPHLHRLAPEVAADLEAGHDRFEGLEREIERDLDRIETATPAERVSLGRRVHERLGALVADQLVHLGVEETRANRILWANLDDAELAAVQGRIIGGIEPAELQDWLERMLKTGHRTEREELRRGLEAAQATAAAARS